MVQPSWLPLTAGRSCLSWEQTPIQKPAKQEVKKILPEGTHGYSAGISN